MDFDSTWLFSNNTKWWTNHEHGLQWLKQCFEPATHSKANGWYRLLIYDSHSSHCTSEFLTHAIEHKILAFVLVPHSSHVTQPLDAIIFSPLKRILSGVTTPLFQLGIDKMQNPEWVEAYYQACNQAFSIKSIKSGFSSTSIFPINANKVLNCIQSVPIVPTISSAPIPITPVLSPSTPPTETLTPFPTQVLTSSPSDFVILQAVNSVLNHIVDAAPLPTPARKFVRCLTSASEKLYTCLSILQEHTEAQKALLAKWKEREAVKCSLIKGKFLLSTLEIHAEKVASECNFKKKKKNKSTSIYLLSWS